jgi:hypothetical protein
MGLLCGILGYFYRLEVAAGVGAVAEGALGGLAATAEGDVRFIRKSGELVAQVVDQLDGTRH